MADSRQAKLRGGEPRRADPAPASAGRPEASRLAPVLGAATLGLAIGLLLAERARPARGARWRGPERREANGLLIGLGGALATTLLERPLVDPLAREVERKSLGLTGALGGPRWLKDLIAVVALDYTLYLWHVATHRVPWLWRLHRIHHADRGLSVATALRFHAAEMAASIPWRLAQVRLIGVSPRALELWRRLSFALVLFHHADLRLPARWERRLSGLIATPGLHAIHHSVRPEERDSNWSSGLTVWDRLHGTLRTQAAEPLEIGVDDGRH